MLLVDVGVMFTAKWSNDTFVTFAQEVLVVLVYCVRCTCNTEPVGRLRVCILLNGISNSYCASPIRINVKRERCFDVELSPCTFTFEGPLHEIPTLKVLTSVTFINRSRYD